MLEHECLIADLAHKLYKPTSSFSLQDLIQVGFHTAFKIASKFDSSKAKISTYLTICIKRDMIHFINSHRNKSRPGDFATDYEDQTPLWELVDGLDERDTAIVILFAEGKSKRQVSKELGIPKKLLEKRLEIIGRDYA
jgi:RNA polymerase sigma factor (sigma-70 family)